MVLKDSANSSISAEPPRGARAARSPPASKRVAAVSRRTGTLMLASASGKHIAKGTLTVRKAGENPPDYLTIDLEKILISGYQLTGANEADTPSESFKLNFVKMKLEYWTQTDKGAKGENANFSWDVAQNMKF